MLYLISGISLVLDIERRVPEMSAALAMQVLLQLCGAHLRGGDAKQALKCLESAGLDDSRAAGLPAEAQQMVLRVKLEAGLLAEVGTNAGGNASSGCGYGCDCGALDGIEACQPCTWPNDAAPKCCLTAGFCHGCRRWHSCIAPWAASTWTAARCRRLGCSPGWSGSG